MDQLNVNAPETLVINNNLASRWDRALKNWVTRTLEQENKTAPPHITKNITKQLKLNLNKANIHPSTFLDQPKDHTNIWNQTLDHFPLDYLAVPKGQPESSTVPETSSPEPGSATNLNYLQHQLENRPDIQYLGFSQEEGLAYSSKGILSTTLVVGIIGGAAYMVGAALSSSDETSEPGAFWKTHCTGDNVVTYETSEEAEQNSPSGKSYPCTIRDQGSVLEDWVAIPFQRRNISQLFNGPAMKLQIGPYGSYSENGQYKPLSTIYTPKESQVLPDTLRIFLGKHAASNHNSGITGPLRLSTNLDYIGLEAEWKY